MSSLSDDLLARAFPRGVPSLVREILPFAWDPANYGGGPIFGSEGETRFYLADMDGRPEWTNAVLREAPGARELLENAPTGVRRMVDIGFRQVEVYLDDLHLEGQPDLMCIAYQHPSGAQSRIELLADLPESSRAGLLGTLAPVWGVGRVARRVGDRQSLLWITEAKTRSMADNGLGVAEVEALAARVFRLPAAYLALKASVPTTYIDGIELYPDGQFDLTPGFR